MASQWVQLPPRPLKVTRSRRGLDLGELQPAGSGGGLLEWWYHYPKDSRGRLQAFAESIVRTMQNRVDEAQMRVPGYRDRVVHVSTSKLEGGMNLNCQRR